MAAACFPTRLPTPPEAERQTWPQGAHCDVGHTKVHLVPGLSAPDPGRRFTMTTRRKRVPRPTEQASGKLQRESVWAGVRRGESVEVTETGLRSAKWEFVAHVTNIVTGDEWIEVVGGKDGARVLRSFRPERVFAPDKPRRKRGPRSSLAEAPRLPLG